MSDAVDNGLRFRLSIGIDIGTSSSCYAFAFSTSPGDIKGLGTTGSDDYKQPTAVLLTKDGQFKEFGEKAIDEYINTLKQGNPNGFELYEDFKMVLYETEEISREGTMAEARSGTKHPVFDLYVKTIKHLVNTARKELDRQDASTIPKSMVRYVLCVPATWTPEARLFLREAAKEAHLVDDVDSPNLLIVLEATAAALFCQRPECRYSNIQQTGGVVKIGARHLVIDAGAGTVDITAQENLETAKVKELKATGGGDYGGRLVDREFLNLLKKVLGADVINKLKDECPKHWHRFMKEFIKQKAKVSDIEGEIEIPIPGKFRDSCANIAQLINARTDETGVSEDDDDLKISRDAVSRIFGSSCDRICDEANEFLNGPDKVTGVERIFLVGGYGKSPLLLAKMKAKFGNKFKIAVPEEARAAVVKGAVMYGINPKSVVLYVESTYGICMYCNFIEGKHRPHKKKIVNKVAKCANVFTPFIRRGQSVEPGIKSDMSCYPLEPDQTRMLIKFYRLDREIGQDEIVYDDTPGVVQIESAPLEMPNTAKGKDREVCIEFTYHEDKISAYIVDTSSDNKNNVDFPFQNTKKQLPK